MAIPFNLPSDEETEVIYRRLDQLLLDLYDLLRQILLRQRIHREPRAAPNIDGQSRRDNAGHRRDEEARVAVLPDLVTSALPLVRKPPVPPPRRRRRRQDKPSARQHQRDAVRQPSPGWLNLGIELRQIAEEFSYSKARDGLKKKRTELKASSLFSLLVPAPLTGSIWTTVIIIVGWRILSRQR